MSDESSVKLPKRIFFTGVPGSRWSGIAQVIESLEGMNTTDRRNHREYTHSGFSGHRGAYFGEGMEFEANCAFTDEAYTNPEAGCMIVKSHEWATDLIGVQLYQSYKQGDWIMLVYRPDLPSLEWWHQAGGFNITYPDYTAYKGPGKMLAEIQRQNSHMLRFANQENLKWSSFNAEWIQETFGQECNVEIKNWTDILVTVFKP